MTPLSKAGCLKKSFLDKMANVYAQTPDYHNRRPFSSLEKKLESDPQFLAAARAGDEQRALEIAKQIAAGYREDYEQRYDERMRSYEAGELEPEHRFAQRVQGAKVDGNIGGGMMGMVGGGGLGAIVSALMHKNAPASLRDSRMVAGAAIGAGVGALGLGKYMGARAKAKAEAEGRRAVTHPGARFNFDEAVTDMERAGHPTYNRLVRGIDDPTDPLSGHVHYHDRKIREMESEMDALRMKVKNQEEDLKRSASQPGSTGTYGSNPDDWNRRG
jgi:hypothetical protein